MRIANIMLSKGLGGIEQSFLDYCEALHRYGYNVTAIIQPDAAISSSIPSYIPVKTLANRGQWDLIARRRMRHLLQTLEVDAIITHGNRAIALTKHAKTYHIGVAHNYNIAPLKECDHIFSITNHLKHTMTQQGIAEKKITTIPNMIDIQTTAPRDITLPSPITIGTMGRFVKKKGFHIFLQALAELKEKDIPFQAIIGGEGEEHKNLIKQSQNLGLQQHVTFTGWVEDKTQFFDQCDIFCLPSLHEPFGIILLEAFAHHVPVISTNSEGPSEIATNGTHCIMVETNNAQQLAHAIDELIATPEKIIPMVQRASALTQTRYSIQAVGKLIDQTLHKQVGFYP